MIRKHLILYFLILASLLMLTTTACSNTATQQSTALKADSKSTTLPVDPNWAKKADMPTARICHAVTAGGKIYTFGINDSAHIYVEEYTPETDKWIKKKNASIMVNKGVFGLTSIDGKIYVVGGYNGKPMNLLEEYDPYKDTWTVKKSMPTAVDCTAAISANGKIYVVGGVDSTDSVSGTVQEYDPVKDNWTLKNSMPTPRSEFGIAEVNGRIYTLGGNGGTGLETEEYDPVKDKWTKKADMLSVCVAFQASVAYGKIYVIFRGKVQEYDPLNNKWTLKGSAPDEKVWLNGVAAIDNKICILGGLKSEMKDIPKGILQNSVWEYNFSTKEKPLAADVDSYWPTSGWRESTPEEQGMNSKALSKLEDFMKIYDLKDVIHSVIVIRHGYKVYDRYYNGFDKDDINNIKSCTKSILSILTGIALKNKHLTSLDQKLVDFYPEYFTKDIVPETRDINLKHLLTMTSGLNINETQEWTFLNSSNWNKLTITSGMSNKPGAKWDYSSPASHLLSGIITKSTKMTTLDFAKKYLLNPLGISMVKWDRDPQGYYFGAGDLYLTPTDMAKIGYLYLKNGNWNGKQIVTDEWVTESTNACIAEAYDILGQYGYLWWTKTMGKYKTYFAAGYGGQLIYVIPDLDMVVVSTSSWDENTKNAHLWFMENLIIPSVDSSSPF